VAGVETKGRWEKDKKGEGEKEKRKRGEEKRGGLPLKVNVK